MMCCYLVYCLWWSEFTMHSMGNGKWNYETVKHVWVKVKTEGCVKTVNDKFMIDWNLYTETYNWNNYWKHNIPHHGSFGSNNLITQNLNHILKSIQINVRMLKLTILQKRLNDLTYINWPYIYISMKHNQINQIQHIICIKFLPTVSILSIVIGFQQQN